MYAVDWMDYDSQQYVHIEAETKERLADLVHDYWSVFYYPIRSVRVAIEPILGQEILDITPFSSEKWPIALQIEEVKDEEAI